MNNPAAEEGRPDIDRRHNMVLSAVWQVDYLRETPFVKQVLDDSILPGIPHDGDSGRNVLDGPGIRNVDLALFRDFGIREGMKLRFRAELTNALSLVSLSNPNAALNSPAVGTIRGALGMRETLLGLRLTF